MYIGRENIGRSGGGENTPSVCVRVCTNASNDVSHLFHLKNTHELLVTSCVELTLGASDRLGTSDAL